MLERFILSNRFTEAEYANIDPSAVGLPKPERYGTFVGVVPVCINTETGTWKFGTRPQKSVDAVREKGVTLDPASEYTVNADNNEITLGTTPLLEAGVTYYFVLESDIVIDGVNWLGFAQQAGGVYTGGKLYYINGSDEWSDSGKDLEFKIYAKTSLEATEKLISAASNWDWSAGWNYNAVLRKTTASTKIAQSFTMPASGGPWYLSRIHLSAAPEGTTGSPDPDRITRAYIYSELDPVPALPDPPIDSAVGSPSYRMEDYSDVTNEAYFPQRGDVADLEVDFKGIMNPDTSLMTNIADILYDIYVNLMGGSAAGLNAVDLAALETARTEVLKVNLDTDIYFKDQLAVFERGQLFKVVPLLDNTFGIKYAEAGEPAGTPHYKDENFKEGTFKMNRGWSSIYSKVKVYYDQHASSQEWQIVEESSDIAAFFYRNQKTLTLETVFKTAADASQLAKDCLGTDPLSSRKQHYQYPKITASFTLMGGLGWDLYPSQTIKLSREHAMASTGSLDGVLFIVTKVTKKTSTGEVDVTARLKSQSY